MVVYYVAIDNKDVWVGKTERFPSEVIFGKWTTSMIGNVDIVYFKTEQEAKTVAIQEIESIMQEYQEQLDKLNGESK
jgi:hypothetical protein